MGMRTSVSGSTVTLDASTPLSCALGRGSLVAAIDIALRTWCQLDMTAATAYIHQSPTFTRRTKMQKHAPSVPVDRVFSFASNCSI